MEVRRGSCLAEVDYSGIEAVLVGWFARDPNYIRLATLGVHSGLASHLLGEPYDPGQLATDPAAVKVYLKTIKQRALKKAVAQSTLYDVSKRVVHGSAYGLTPVGMTKNWPGLFPRVSAAQKAQQAYFAMAPSIPRWQTQVQQFAYDHGFLGGPGEPPYGHPFAYKHWFWAVSSLRPLTTAAAHKRTAAGEPIVWVHEKPYAQIHGEDAKRAIAFYPQSTGRAILTEAMLALFDPASETYIGDAYFGRTPLRAPIHDSLFLELPWRIADRVLEIVCAVMSAPIAAMPNPAAWNLGTHLSIGVEAKVGSDWSRMAAWGDAPTAEPALFTAALSEDDDDLAALQVVA